MINFSENVVDYDDGQLNASRPPDTILNNGLLPETATSRGQALPAQWLNWLFRTVFRYINRDRVTDKNGIGLFPYSDCSIRLEAIDMDTPANYLVAIGYKGSTGAHVMTVVYSNVLSLGSATIDGNQPILGGGPNIRVTGYSRTIGEL